MDYLSFLMYAIFVIVAFIILGFITRGYYSILNFWNSFGLVGIEKSFNYDLDDVAVAFFRAVKDKENKCCPYTANDWDNIDFCGYKTAADAYKGHLKICDKLSKKQILNKFMNFKPIKFSPNKRLLKKIIKTCGSAFDFVNEYIEDSSEVSDIRRM